jgi:predicted nucleotidyltransferase
MAIPKDIEEALITIAVRFPAIEKILLFGSRAHGDHSERSDIDLFPSSAFRIFCLEWSKSFASCRMDLPSLKCSFLICSILAIFNLPFSPLHQSSSQTL